MKQEGTDFDLDLTRWSLLDTCLTRLLMQYGEENIVTYFSLLNGPLCCSFLNFSLTHIYTSCFEKKLPSLTQTVWNFSSQISPRDLCMHGWPSMNVHPFKTSLGHLGLSREPPSLEAHKVAISCAKTTNVISQQNNRVLGRIARITYPKDPGKSYSMGSIRGHVISGSTDVPVAGQACLNTTR